MSSTAPMQQAKADTFTNSAQHTSQLTTQSQQISASDVGEFADLRPRTTTQRQRQDAANHSLQSRQLKTFQHIAQHSGRAAQLKSMGAMMDAPAVQRMSEEEEATQAKSVSENTAQLETAAEVPKPNNTGLPDNLKSGIESLSGMSMDHVKVHYNSSQPAQLNAHAYAQGSEIHVAPGQEQHLPHEAWHVVQQAQGRVQPTMQMKAGVAVNDDVGLEAEADVMGERAMQMVSAQTRVPEVDAQAQYPTPSSQSMGMDGIQRKVLIENKPYSYQDGTERLHGSGSNMQHTFAPTNKVKAREWSNDSWKRHYESVSEFQDHSSGAPVNVGVFEALGLWYELPFKTGTPFVLAENHSTKVTPIMKESNRRGTILHESNGVIPIKSKEKALKPDAPAGFHKTAMESVIAKTLFGVVYHTASRMKPKVAPNYIVESPAIWIEHYAAADEDGKGKDDMQRPYYTNEAGIKVIQGENLAGEYSSINTMKRVKDQFDAEAEDYIAHSDKERAITYVRTTKEALEVWWTNMLEVSELYKSPELNADRIAELETAIGTQRTRIIERLKTLFNDEYKTEITTKPEQGDGGLEERRQAALAAGLRGELAGAMAMRDLAMLTVILNTEDWGDHEMIAMGATHVQTLKSVIQSRVGLQVITRDEFIDGSKNAL
ncbi:DUF4157 domain-containing protein [Undibacterium amnicola]|uniref:eCIS core domain-containing protein n=1 Tax=Undibacterium amnicola TaxID=1834038 RepID=UPI001FE4D7E0|nr:DUF4157 domain-containing protein [Undibacterium amnicola]